MFGYYLDNSRIQELTILQLEYVTSKQECVWLSKPMVRTGTGYDKASFTSLSIMFRPASIAARP